MEEVENGEVEKNSDDVVVEKKSDHGVVENEKKDKNDEGEKSVQRRTLARGFPRTRWRIEWTTDGPTCNTPIFNINLLLLLLYNISNNSIIRKIICLEFLIKNIGL